MKHDFLFVYGTLLDDNNEYAIYLKNNSRPYLTGKVRGKLFDIGEYPGAILAAGDQIVYGSILQISDADRIIPIIDEYEGYGENQPQPNEFVRIRADIETAHGWVSCWMYLYNLSTAGLILIESGRYTR